MTEQEYQARIEELEKENANSFDRGFNYGGIVAGLACIAGGILGMIYDHYSENKNKK